MFKRVEVTFENKAGEQETVQARLISALNTVIYVVLDDGRILSNLTMDGLLQEEQFTVFGTAIDRNNIHSQIKLIEE